jgi:hypothetical protein
MTALENVRNFIIVIIFIRLIVNFAKDGKPQPLYNFNTSLIGACITLVIYYFLGLFS